MYKYKIKNLKLFGYHGVYNKERLEGQNFYVDFSFNLYDNLCVEDNLSEVIDYTVICTEIESVFNNKRYRLIESLLNDIKLFFINKYSDISFELTIKKKNKFMDNDLEYISVSVNA